MSSNILFNDATYRYIISADIMIISIALNIWHLGAQSGLIES